MLTVFFYVGTGTQTFKEEIVPKAAIEVARGVGLCSISFIKNVIERERERERERESEREREREKASEENRRSE